ncbi:MAG: hydrogen peroxide-dependent heme synthase [Gemmatimonadota bacterium]
MHDTELPPATLEGWYLLHQLFRLPWPALKQLPADRTAAMASELAGVLADASASPEGGWSGVYRIYGGGSDLLFLHFRPSLEEIGQAERTLQLTELGDHLQLTRDYVSVVELGLYALTTDLAHRMAERDEPVSPEEWAAEVEAALAEHRELGYVQRRLHPVQPEEMPYVCFYPMNKRRSGDRNWYTLSLEQRSQLMHEHGTVGRRYAGRISQIISGSMGLDDWEWAVTLFARDPLDFKDVVTEMRFDKASAEYAEFGDFYVGKRVRPDEWEGIETW